jgi:glycosyltransferase involved in cell wall biosynthesis
VTDLGSDPWLRARVDLTYLNTAPKGDKVPGAWTWGNLARTVVHAARIGRAVRGRRADVMHLNLAATPSLPLARALALAATGRLAGARVILHAHTGQLEACVRSRAFAGLLRLTLRVVDAFVVVSRSGERAVRSVAGPRARTVIRIQNGIDAGPIPTGPKGTTPPTIAFVGTVCERKGLLDLRDALGQLAGSGGPAAEVVVVGDGEQEDPGALDRIRDAYRAAGRHDVRFTGALANDEVRAILARADIFCLPSHSEGAPLSVLEAMSAADAVVATDVGDVPEMLDEGRAGVIVAARDPAALAGALRPLLEDEERRAALGRAARRRVERGYSWERMREEILDLYLRVAGPERPPVSSSSRSRGPRPAASRPAPPPSAPGRTGSSAAHPG